MAVLKGGVNFFFQTSNAFVNKRLLVKIVVLLYL